jgi:dUTP pyrophosphatase
MKSMKVRVVALPHAQDLPLPAYQTSGSAGFDLVAAVAADKPMRLKRGARVLVPTGLVFDLPAGYELQIRPRSGLAARHGVTVLNTPGTIDSDYRGEVQVILINHGETTFSIQRGDRIAQAVFSPVTHAVLVAAKSARATARGSGGFGSTGMKAATTTGKKKPEAKRGQTRRKRAPLAKTRPMSIPRGTVSATTRRR